ncbi:MAG: DUF58 domain-containing protein [Cytophagales bacterium]|nr:DUF58 domain-containing protein [Cytophagales bacterium]MDW8385277.1 DUF58 domain-containing protein [Flammeovirgaceae bacterium]
MIDFKQVREYSNLELFAKQMVEGFITGLHKSPYHGFSVEFAEHRLYNPGETTRHIDWKVYAKTDRLYSKRYEEETNLRCMILLDRSSSMYYPVENNGKFLFSCFAAAALAYLLHKQRDAVGLCTFSEQIEHMTPVKSTSAHLYQIYSQLNEFLQTPTKQKKTAIAQVIHQIAQKIHKRSLVILFSDMMDNTAERQEEVFSALQHLKHEKHEVILFHVFDKKTELEFDFSERPYLFIDIETGQQEKIQPNAVRESYMEQIQQRYKNIKLRCAQYKIDFVEVDCASNVDKVLLPFLIKRSKLY